MSKFIGGRGTEGRGRSEGTIGRGEGRGEGRGRGGDGGRRGGREGGRDAGRGRGRDTELKGRNRHMGENVSIMSLLNMKGMMPKDILEIVNPPQSDRNRSLRIDHGAMAYSSNASLLPGHSSYRLDQRIGKVLDSRTQVVRSNHYKINTSMIPGRLYQYAVHIFLIDRSGKVSSEDESITMDNRKSTMLLIRLRDSHPEWNIGRGVGFTYNGKAIAYTTSALPMPGRTTDDNPMVSEDIVLHSPDGTVGSQKYRVSLILAEELVTPPAAAYQSVNSTILNALDTALLGFARWQIVENNPEWFLVGSQAFQSTSQKYQLSPAYVALQGYYVGLKTCLAGLVLVCDMTASAFLSGGFMIDVIAAAANTNREQLFEICRRGMDPRLKRIVEEAIKNCKVTISYLGQGRKCKSLGPASNSLESQFSYEGKMISVATYFEMMAVGPKGAQYRKVMPSGRLQYPHLPTINVGSEAKAILIPCELVIVPSGQCRSQKITGDMAAQMIRYAAVRPDERMKFICGNNDHQSLVSILRRDQTTAAFGVDKIEPEPLAVQATLLPQAKLRFLNEAVSDPGLSGTWNFENKKFVEGASRSGDVPFGVLIVGDGPPRGEWKEQVSNFIKAITSDGANLGCRLSMTRTPLTSAPYADDLKRNIELMKAEVRIIFVLMLGDFYATIKRQADPLGIVTQCIKWKNIDRPPRSFTLNLMLKVNTKLGGINHTLVSRLESRPTGSATFQDPPASLSWVFDVPCMFVGMDVSHGEIGSMKESIAAVVASMDGKAGQYAAYVTAQKPRQEMISALTDAMVSLLQTFKGRNHGRMPLHVIIYRDGVSDSQFDQVVNIELPAVRQAFELLGYMADSVKIAVVVCQKGHHTRLMYEERDGSNINHINPCPGLVVDASGGSNSITSAILNEFYLNSHVAIQGTAKPCKYCLVYDDIHFKVAELELMTYWTTYLYCRANKSVSYAAPAYYAHWASKRGRYLQQAGANADDLVHISNVWGGQRPNHMFWV